MNWGGECPVPDPGRVPLVPDPGRFTPVQAPSPRAVQEPSRVSDRFADHRCLVGLVPDLGNGV